MPSNVHRGVVNEGSGGLVAMLRKEMRVEVLNPESYLEQCILIMTRWIHSQRRCCILKDQTMQVTLRNHSQQGMKSWGK